MKGLKLEASALTEWLQVVIGFIGVVGLIYTPRQNTRALEQGHRDYLAENHGELILTSIRAIPSEVIGAISIEIRLHNKGRTVVRATEDAFVLCFDEEGFYAEPEINPILLQEPIHPGATAGLPRSFMPPGGRNIADIEDGKVKLFLKGIIYYDDMLGVARHVLFYRIYDHIRGRFAPLPENSFFAEDKARY